MIHFIWKVCNVQPLLCIRISSPECCLQIAIWLRESDCFSQKSGCSCFVSATILLYRIEKTGNFCGGRRGSFVFKTFCVFLGLLLTVQRNYSLFCLFEANWMGYFVLLYQFVQICIYLCLSIFLKWKQSLYFSY